MKHHMPSRAPKPLTLQLDAPPDFRFEQLAAYLARSSNECLFSVADGTLTRCIPVTDKLRPIVRIRQAPDGRLNVSIELDTRTFDSDATIRAEGPLGSEGSAEADNVKMLVDRHIRQYVTEWLDLHTDLSPFYELASRDRLLRMPAERFRGLRLVGVPDLFEAVAWAILGQQINLPFAYTLKRRLVEAFGSSVTDAEGNRHWLFPTAERIAGLQAMDLTELKMTAGKAEYLLRVAGLIRDGALSKAQLLAAGDAPTAERMLTAIRGIGPWTAHYVAMRCLRYRDAFPIQDVGLHLAIQHELGLDRKPTLPEIRQFSSAWRGWEAYAVVYLWRTLY